MSNAPQITLVVSIPDDLLLTWASQAVQYQPRGDPGFGYKHVLPPEGELVPPQEIHCLLWYGEWDHGRRLEGILNYYPVDIPPYEHAGNVNLWVRPTMQGRGIGTRLLAEAERRWGPFDFEQQRYTRAGAAMVRAYLQKHRRND